MPQGTTDTLQAPIRTRAGFDLHVALGGSQRREGIVAPLFKTVVLAALALLLATSAHADDLAWLDAYDVTWTTPSVHAGQSMPCGGGGTGLNVWVEKGDLLIYAQRSGCFDENNQYLKLGRLRVRLDPNPFAPAVAGGAAPVFQQRLRLRDGRVEIEGKRGAASARILVWADVFHPAVHIEIEATEPVGVRAAYETWRHVDADVPDSPSQARFAILGWAGFPGKVTRFRDEIAFQGDEVFFHHRNRDDHLLFDYTVRQQGLESVKDQLVDTQRGRTFGGILRGTGFRAAGTSEGTYAITPFKAWTLASEKASRSHHLELITHIAQTKTLNEWTADLRANIAALPPLGEAREASRRWWEQFWRRSHIVINADRSDPKSRPWQMARNYQLFRYQLGTNFRGEYPTKFNGGNFTYDPSLVHQSYPYDPDWRAWGPGNHGQNQRLVHWPMLKAGDADLVTPQLDFYRRALPSAIARVRTYYGHEGALFPEVPETSGLPISGGWGWTEPEAKSRQRGKEIPFGDPRADGDHAPGRDRLIEHGEQANAYVSYHYESQLEMSYLALERHRFSGDDIATYLPFIRQSVRFFDEHYQLRHKMRTGSPLDDQGRLVIFPSTACETYRGARNPTDVLAGLSACLDALLALDDTLVPPAEKDYYRGFKTRLPGYTFGEDKRDRIVEPAESWHHIYNIECPQFYPLFPFNRFSLADPGFIQVFRDTWQHGTFEKRLVQSWHQNGIFFARMGLTAEAADFNGRKLADSERRFPSFWGPGHDWAPDHNWGGSGMIGLQEMLFQTVGDELRLLPAWPQDWDVDFKLHAPRQTTVEVSYRAGKIQRLEVTPASRRADVVLPSTVEEKGSAPSTKPEPTPTRPPLTVIAFGDSLTEGRSGGDMAWVQRVEKQSGGKLKVINEGKSGRGTSDGKADFEKMTARQPHADLVIIALGTNDSRDLQPGSVEKAADNVRHMIDHARESYGPAVRLLLVAPPNLNKATLVATKPIANEREAQLKALGAAFEKLAKEKQCDFVSLFGTVPEQAMLQDGVHPDPFGHTRMAKVLSQKLSAITSRTPTAP